MIKRAMLVILAISIGLFIDCSTKLNIKVISAESKKEESASEENTDVEVPIISLALTGEQMTNLIADNTGLSARRKAVIIQGLELLGFTKYNLGSKVSDDYTEKPTYLDCSGFVEWTIVRATGINIGNDTASQYAKATPITESELQIGDLGFKKPGGTQNLGGGNHVGIFVGYTNDGEKLWLHCTSGSQNGVNITTHDNLQYYARPTCYD